MAAVPQPVQVVGLGSAVRERATLATVQCRLLSPRSIAADGTVRPRLAEGDGRPRGECWGRPDQNGGNRCTKCAVGAPDGFSSPPTSVVVVARIPRNGGPS